MTDHKARGGVSEAEIEAAARVIAREFCEIGEDGWRPFRPEARSALEAALQVRAGQDHGGEASEVEGLTRERDDARFLLDSYLNTPVGKLIAAAEARAAKAVEVLRKCEWPGDSMAQPQCPCCRRYKDWGHLSDCALATLLSDHPAPEPSVDAGEVRP